MGTRAAFGGVHAATPNPGDCIGLQLDRAVPGGLLAAEWRSRRGFPVVNVAGCPAHPRTRPGGNCRKGEPPPPNGRARAWTSRRPAPGRWPPHRSPGPPRRSASPSASSNSSTRHHAACPAATASAASTAGCSATPPPTAARPPSPPAPISSSIARLAKAAASASRYVPAAT